MIEELRKQRRATFFAGGAVVKKSPFLLLTFLLGKQKKSKKTTRAYNTTQHNTTQKHTIQVRNNSHLEKGKGCVKTLHYYYLKYFCMILFVQPIANINQPVNVNIIQLIHNISLRQQKFKEPSPIMNSNPPMIINFLY